MNQVLIPLYLEIGLALELIIDLNVPKEFVGSKLRKSKEHNHCVIDI